MKKAQLELWRQLFADTRTHISIAKIVKLDLLTDRSELRCEIEIWPEKVGAIARLTWDQVGPNSGVFGFPNVNDLVLVAAADGNFDQLFVIRRLTSNEDKIPLQATDGSTTIKSLDGKKVKIHSDTRINLGRQNSDTNAEIDQNLVLGQVFKTHQSKYLSDVSVHRHLCMPPGYFSVVPNNAGEYTNERDNVIDNEAILSDLVFTEK